MSRSTNSHFSAFMTSESTIGFSSKLLNNRGSVEYRFVRESNRYKDGNALHPSRLDGAPLENEFEENFGPRQEKRR